MEIAKGQTVEIGAYSLTASNIESGQNENYGWSILTLDVAKNGVPRGQIKPEKRLYTVSRQQTSEVAIRRRLDEDLYVNFAGTNGPDKMVIQTYVFPLVSWIWIGYWVVLIGTIVCMVPSKSRLVFPRTEVVGIAGKHVKV
jgi:cytochrome c-type biogenesis protein CcmF